MELQKVPIKCRNGLLWAFQDFADFVKIFSEFLGFQGQRDQETPINQQARKPILSRKTNF